MSRTLRLLSSGLLCSLTTFGQPAAGLPAFQPNEIAEAEIPPVGTAAPGRFYNLFRPFRTEAAALSPDGKLIAYSVREGDNLYVLTVDIDHPAKVLAKILAGTTKTSTPFLQPDIAEATPARIRWMGWATDNRLLIETNAVIKTGLGSGSGGLFGVNADGSNPRTLLTPRDLSFLDSPGHSPFAASVSAFSPSSPDMSYLIGTPDVAPAPAPFDQNPSVYEREVALMNRDNDLPLDLKLAGSPTFFDYAPGEPDWIVVRTNNPTNYGLYRVHIDSGKLRYGPTENATGDIATLLNRQGLIGASVPNSFRSGFPHAFQVPKPSLVSLGRWNPLSSIATEPGADFSVSPENFFGHRSFPVGFDENPDVLYYASNVGRDTYALYGLNLKTGGHAGRIIESPDIDLATPSPDGFASPNPLVFDRYTRELVGVRYQSIVRSAVWLRSDLQTIQTSMEKEFPGRSVDILEWDRTASRFLALVRGPTEPGSFYIVDRGATKALEFVRRSDLPAESEPRFTRYFTVANPAGGQLTGFVVIPDAVRQKPIPLVVICADDPWQPAPAEFDGEINALAQMGFAVMQINPRGTWGLGAKYRASAGDAFDEAQTADILTAIDALAKTLPIHPQRVALLGRARGGFLALRAAQLRPDRFRCVVGLDPTVNLSNWINYTRWTTNHSAPALTRAFFGPRLLESNPLLNDARSHKCPVFLLAYRGSEGGSPTQMYLDARTLARKIENDGTPVEFRTLSFDYMRRMPEARSDIMRHIEDFLNLNIYRYDVQMGATKLSSSW